MTNLKADNDSEHKNCTECGTAYGFVNCRYTILSAEEPIHICLNCAKDKARIVSQRKSQAIPTTGNLTKDTLW